jgi:SMC protein-like protein
LKIEKVQINAFGNLENKQIELGENINIIKGKNESGKSTFLKFMVDMFYGISKNKRGKEFSDYDRYKPWNNEEFSGKITYKLDNGKKYEVFRDFNKKNPKIYNEEGEDISKEYTIDKVAGSKFFTEQTKIEENTFLSTFAACQTEVKLEKQEQNILVQKLANLAGTGEDNVSYKKALEKLNKKQVEEIGTLRTTGRPMNLVKEEQFKLQDEIGELETYKEERYIIDENKNTLESKVQENEQELEILKQIKRLYENRKIEEQKLEIQQTLINSDEEKIQKLKSEKKEIELEYQEIENNINKKAENKAGKKQKTKIKNIIMLLIFIIGIALGISCMQKIIVAIIAFSIAAVMAGLLIMAVIKSKKENKKIQEINEQKKLAEKQLELSKNEIEKLNAQIEMLNKTKEEKIVEIQNQKQKINVNLQEKLQEIENEYKISNIQVDSNISYKIENLQEELNKNKLALHKLELDKNSIMPKLEKLASMEEQLQELNEKEIMLKNENEAIELAKEVLETAYIKMKENVTPKFTENLSKNIEKISNGKYQKVKINDEEGIIVEKQNGEYVSAEKLSVGTIEQLYLSLRFGAISELSEESMPIILDEAFAYYDEERLKNILTYINKEYKNNQIIIFTCTNREIEILNKEEMKYNLVEM